MTTPDRDRSLEQWLRKTPIPGASAEQCFDAEILAAWAEGVLEGPARAAAEAHAASCGRCQAMLAVMARTTPTPSPATGTFLRKWMTMLGPAVAAAAAVALWFAVDERRTPSVPETTATQIAGDPAAPPAAEEASRFAAEKDRVASPDSQVARQLDAATPLVESRRDFREGAAADKKTTDAASVQKEGERENEQKTPAAPAAAPKPAAPLASPAGGRVESVPVAGSRVNAPYPGPPPQQQANQVASNQSQVGQAQLNQAQVSQSQAQGQRAEPATEQAKKAEAQAPQRPAAAQEPVAITAEKPLASPAPPPPPAARSTVAERASADVVGDELRRRASAVAVAEIIAPDNSARWRVVQGRIVQGSSDAGATWTNQFNGADGVELTTGAAVSPTVCWFAGRAGVVILTTDGRQWRPMTLPERADLVSIVATDARSATVTAADGRVFATTDGGRTWTRR